MDKFFRVEVIAQTPNPQQLIWLSAHQCVCEGAAIDDKVPDEDKAGEYAVKHLLAGHRGHYSALEGPQISFNAIGFNHRTMQQLTRHRVGVHFSVQSLRYTSDRFIKVANVIQDVLSHTNGVYDKRIAQAVSKWIHVQEAIESVIYLRPAGEYSDRNGHRYDYCDDERIPDLISCAEMIIRYANKIEQGYSEEHCAGLLPMDTRQNWVMSYNVRSLMHTLDLRAKADAQLEIRQLCDLMWPYFEQWVPSIADWYRTHRFGKARLAP